MVGVSRCSYTLVTGIWKLGCREGRASVPLRATHTHACMHACEVAGTHTHTHTHTHALWFMFTHTHTCGEDVSRNTSAWCTQLYIVSAMRALYSEHVAPPPWPPAVVEGGNDNSVCARVMFYMVIGCPTASPPCTRCNWSTPRPLLWYTDVYKLL